MLLQAYEEELLFENEQICVSRWKLLPGDAVGQHQDDYAQVVIALQGGVVTRIGADGSSNEILLPTGKAVYQEADRELHDAFNTSDAPIEALMIELKSATPQAVDNRSH